MPLTSRQRFSTRALLYCFYINVVESYSNMCRYVTRSLLTLSLLALSACRAGAPNTFANAPSRSPLNLRQMNAQSQVNAQSQRMYSLDELRSEIAKGVFQRLDQNQNMILEPVEYQARFSVVRDLNNNGAVELTEFVQQKESVLLALFSVAKMQTAFKGAFEKKDLDKDGFVSFQEDREINMIFDYNGDQRYSYPEFEDALASTFNSVKSRVQEWIDAHFAA